MPHPGWLVPDMDFTLQYLRIDGRRVAIPSVVLSKINQPVSIIARFYQRQGLGKVDNTLSLKDKAYAAIKDAILTLLGSIINLIRAILDIPDDFEEWLSDLFNVSFGLLDMIGTLVLEFLGNCNPIYSIDDPFEIMEADNGLIPVRIPIRDLSVRVDDVELTVEANVGA